MVVQNSVTFSVIRIGSQVNRSKALNHPRWPRLLVSSCKMGRHRFDAHHNWSVLKSDRFSLQNTLPVSLVVGPLTLEVDHIGFATPADYPSLFQPYTRKKSCAARGWPLVIGLPEDPDGIAHQMGH